MKRNQKQLFYLILPWLLLGFLAYKDRYKNMIISQTHLFLFKTYYYAEENGEPASYSITLMNAERKTKMDGWQFKCVYFNKQNLPVKSVDAEFMPMYTEDWLHHAGCKLAHFHIKCKKPVEISQQNAADNWIMKLRVKRSPLIETYIESVSSTKRHRLVFCPNRIYNFERWQVFLTTMELYRQYGVELTIVHVQSVYPEIYDLMQYYVREGRLQFRDYLGMPMVNSLSYNPNSETVYAAQTTHMLDCLFAFRENTDFMIMADWDDIVVPPNQRPIPLVLEEFVAKHPYVGSFYLQRLLAFIPTLEMLNTNYTSLSDFWNNGIGYEINSFEKVGKSIVRPALVGSAEIHHACMFKEGFEEAIMPTEILHILHARYQNESMSMHLDASSLSMSFDKFMQRNGLNNMTLWAKLPSEERMVKQIVDCFNDLGKVLRSTGRSCHTHYSCPMVDIQKDCLTYSNKWESEFSRGVSASVFRHSEKLKMSQSCKSNVY